MRREFYISTDKTSTAIASALNDALALPDWDSLDSEQQMRLVEDLGQDDEFLDLLVLSESAYKKAEHLAGDEPAEEVLDSECFRGAEWLNTTLQLYVGKRAVELLDLDVTVEEMFTAGGPDLERDRDA